jgi:ubiquinone/menaquinone biosynthesis C-methylase UbiE
VLRRLAARPGARPREAIGVDHSPRMLAGAGALPPGWSTVEADARAVPLPDGWADVVTCAYVLHLLGAEARAAVLTEAGRLLAPAASSRLAIVTIGSDRALVRAALRLLARGVPSACAALCPYDPADDLARTAWVAARRVRLPRRGYPSLVVLAKRAPPT